MNHAYDDCSEHRSPIGIEDPAERATDTVIVKEAYGLISKPQKLGCETSGPLGDAVERSAGENKIIWLGSNSIGNPFRGRDEILVRVIPDRSGLAQRLLGAGRSVSPTADSVAELVRERDEED